MVMETKSIKVCNHIIEKGLISLIIFAPLAFGSVEVWGYSIIILSAVALTLVWLIKVWLKNRLKFTIFKKEPIAFKLGYLKTPLNLPIIIFIVLIIIQLIPLPESVVRFISPNTCNIYAESYKALEASVIAKNPLNTSYSLSLCPNATKDELFKIIGYALIFFLVINNIKSKVQLKKLILTIVIVAFCLSIFGIIQKAFWNGKIYWFRELRYGGTPFGSYVNRNHYAGFMVMAIPLALSAIAITKSINKKIILSYMALIMASTIFISLSRGGMLAFLGSFLFILLSFLFHKTLKKHISFIIMLLMGIVIFILYLQLFSVVADRLLTVIDPDELLSQKRFLVWKDSLNIVSDFPLLGSGLGTFRYIFPKYKTFYNRLIFQYPENDYLQLLTETGIIGFLIIIWGLLAFLIASFKLMAKNKILIFFIGSIFAILIHSFCDFNLHIPANALIFSIILALTIRFGYEVQGIERGEDAVNI